MEQIVFAAGQRSPVRFSLGVLELLGFVKMDLYGALLWEHQDLRDAGAGLPRVSAVCG